VARRSRKGPMTLWDKVKKIDAEFAEGVYSLSDDQLNNKLIDIAKQSTLNENEMAKDTDLKSLREQAKVAAETYTIPLKALKMKRQLIYKVLEERGKAP
jgi:hypothetical protein